MSANDCIKSANLQIFLFTKSDISDFYAQPTSDLAKSAKGWITSGFCPRNDIKHFRPNVLKKGIPDTKHIPLNIQEARIKPCLLYISKGEIRTLDLAGMSRALSPTELPCRKSNFNSTNQIFAQTLFYFKSLISLAFSNIYVLQNTNLYFLLKIIVDSKIVL